jgi:hypothetical protein
MVKNDSLSSDIDLIKELESLRIKQKLLVESLSKKSGEHENILLSHIDAKLEFLVKIFQDTSAPVSTETEKVSGEDSGTDETKSESFESKLFERLETIETSMIARFGELEEKISKLKTSQNSSQSSLPSEKVENNDNLPPVPTFNDSSNKEVSKSTDSNKLEDTEKKKKWF